jgi:hypothetical protein
MLLDHATVDRILAAMSAEDVLAVFSAREPAPGEAAAGQ